MECFDQKSFTWTQCLLWTYIYNLYSLPICIIQAMASSQAGQVLHISWWAHHQLCLQGWSGMSTDTVPMAVLVDKPGWSGGIVANEYSVRIEYWFSSSCCIFSFCLSKMKLYEERACLFQFFFRFKNWKCWASIFNKCYSKQQCKDKACLFNLLDSRNWKCWDSIFSF